MTVSNMRSRPLDYKEAIDQCVDECLEIKKFPGDVLDDSSLERLSSDAFRELALYGWISAANNSIHTRRGTAELRPATPRSGGHPVNGRNPRAAWGALDIPWSGARGGMISLKEFDLEDLQALYDEASAQEQGWGDRRRWAETAMAMIGGGKKRIEQLPKSQQKELARLALEAWT